MNPGSPATPPRRRTSAAPGPRRGRARKLFALGSLALFLAPFSATGNSLDLAGEWRLRLDAQDEGVSADEHGYLVRRHLFVGPAWIETHYRIAGLAGRGATVLHASSEDLAHGNVAANALNGDPATFWHTRWQPQTDPLPHFTWSPPPAESQSGANRPPVPPR